MHSLNPKFISCAIWSRWEFSKDQNIKLNYYILRGNDSRRFNEGSLIKSNNSNYIEKKTSIAIFKMLVYKGHGSYIV